MFKFFKKSKKTEKTFEEKISENIKTIDNLNIKYSEISRGLFDQSTDLINYTNSLLSNSGVKRD